MTFRARRSVCGMALPRRTYDVPMHVLALPRRYEAAFDAVIISDGPFDWLLELLGAARD